MNSIKTKLLVIGTLVLVVLSAIFIYAFLLSDESKDSSSALCTSDTYLSIANGMNKGKITDLMGEPTAKRVKQSSDQNLFSQGNNEVNIFEGWVYNKNMSATSAEIYFGSNGSVIGKSCGQG